MDNNTNLKKKESTLFAGLAIVVAVMVCLCIAGIFLINPPEETVQGQVEATHVRVSGKLPGRVVAFYVEEGQSVKQGDTLAYIHSSTVDAKLLQAQAMEQAASAQNRKAEAGTRSQIINAAYDQWQQAIAAESIRKKTYERMENLFKQGVVSEQKRDEARAAYDAAAAQARAARSQYDLAVEGAQTEDKQAAQAQQQAARGTVMEVESILEDQYLTAPCDGEVTLFRVTLSSCRTMFINSVSRIRAFRRYMRTCSDRKYRSPSVFPIGKRMYCLMVRRSMLPLMLGHV